MITIYLHDPTNISISGANGISSSMMRFKAGKSGDNEVVVFIEDGALLEMVNVLHQRVAHIEELRAKKAQEESHISEGATP